MYNEVIYSNLKEKVYINQWRAISLIISIIYIYIYIYTYSTKSECVSKKKKEKRKKKKLKANVISLEILTVLLFSRCQYLLVSCSPYFFSPLF